MNVFQQFDGDDDTKLMWIQHDCYGSSLSLMRKHAERSVSEAIRSELKDIGGIDHRTLQNAHDVLAAAFRHHFHGCSGYKKVTVDKIFGMLHQNKAQKTDMDIVHEWQDWLEQNLENEIEIGQEISKIMLNQNTNLGYKYEDKLKQLIHEKFDYISWIKPETELPISDVEFEASAPLTPKEHFQKLLNIIMNGAGQFLKVILAFVTLASIFCFFTYYTYLFLEEHPVVIPVAVMVGFFVGILWSEDLPLFQKCLAVVGFSILAVYAFFLLSLLLSFTGNGYDEPCYANRYC